WAAVARRAAIPGTLNKQEVVPAPPGASEAPHAFLTERFLATMRRLVNTALAATAWVTGKRDDVSMQVDKPANDEDERTTRRSAGGLAFSGGGIRSATFCLGALQAIAKDARFFAFDFCSTVSGGGFVGGWWSAWLSRAERQTDKRAFPPDERLEP